MTDRTVLLYNISDQVEVEDRLSKILSSTNRGYSYSSSKNGNLALLTFVDKNDVSKFPFEEEHSVFMSKMCDEVFCSIEAYISPESGSAIERLTVEQWEQLHANLTHRKDDNNIIMTDSLVKLENFATTFLKLLSHGAEIFRLNEAAGKEEHEIKEIGSGTEPVQRKSYVYTTGEFSGGKMDNENLNVFIKVSAEVAPWVYSFISHTDDEWNQIQEQAAVTVRQNDGKHTIHGSSLNCLQIAQHILFSLIGKVEPSVLNQKTQIQDYEISSDEDIYRAAECNTGNYGTHPKSTKLQKEASSLASRNINSCSKNIATDCDHKVQNTHETNDSEEVETGDNNALNALENRSTNTIQSDTEALSPTWIVEDPVSQSTRSHGENVTEDQQEVKMQQNNIISQQMTNLSDHVADCNDNGASTHGPDDHDGNDGDEFESFIVINEPETGSFVHIVNQAANLQENSSAVINDSNVNLKETPPPTNTRTEETRGQDTEKAIPARGDIHGNLQAEQNNKNVTINLADEDSAMGNINKPGVLTTSVEVDSKCNTKIVPMTSPAYNEEEYKTTSDVTKTNGDDSELTKTDGDDTEVIETDVDDTELTKTDGDDTEHTETDGQYSELFETDGELTKTDGDDTKLTNTIGDDMELTETDGDDTELYKTGGDDTKLNETGGDDIELNVTGGDDMELTETGGDDIELTGTGGDDMKLTKTSGDDTELTENDRDDIELTETGGDDTELTGTGGDDIEFTKTGGDDTELIGTGGDDIKLTKTDGDDTELTGTGGNDMKLTKTGGDDTELTETGGDDTELTGTGGDDMKLTETGGDDTELTGTSGDDMKLTKTDGDDGDLTKTDRDDTGLTETGGDDKELTKTDRDDMELTGTGGDDTELTWTGGDKTELSKTDGDDNEFANSDGVADDELDDRRVFISEKTGKSYVSEVDLAKCLEELRYCNKTQEGIEVTIYMGDITKEDADVIVNAANSSLEHGGGVALAISKAGGSTIKKESRQIIKKCGELPPCTVCHTTGGKLKCKHIIHAVAPIWREEGEHSKQRMHVLLLKIFTYAAEKLQAKSVALPAIGTGVYGMPIDICASTFHTAIREYSLKCDEKATVKDIRIVLYDVEVTGEFLIEFCNAVSDDQQNNDPVGTITPSVDLNPSKWTPSDPYAVDSKYKIAADKGATHLSKNVKTASPATDKKDIAIKLTGSGYCEICTERGVSLMSMNCCQSTMCGKCFNHHFEYDGKCPFCTLAVLVTLGTQPDGEMDFNHHNNFHLPGYESSGTVIIDYTFPGGTQKACHPNPGKRYRGTKRRAFLPASGEGLQVLALLKMAFDRRILFTIGRSATTGVENTVIWNDIHHKTSPTGGPANYGYPDPTYLDRVKAELAAKGFH